MHAHARPQSQAVKEAGAACLRTQSHAARLCTVVRRCARALTGGRHVFRVQVFRVQVFRMQVFPVQPSRAPRGSWLSSLQPVHQAAPRLPFSLVAHLPPWCDLPAGTCAHFTSMVVPHLPPWCELPAGTCAHFTSMVVPTISTCMPMVIPPCFAPLPPPPPPPTQTACAHLTRTVVPAGSTCAPMATPPYLAPSPPPSTLHVHTSRGPSSRLAARGRRWLRRGMRSGRPCRRARKAAAPPARPPPHAAGGARRRQMGALRRACCLPRLAERPVGGGGHRGWERRWRASGLSCRWRFTMVGNGALAQPSGMALVSWPAP
eukprot:353651-Chlamydomonas_euryale.AAC.2